MWLTNVLIIIMGALLWYRVGDRTEPRMPPRSDFPPGRHQ
jgi:hypothetical protein